MTALAAEVAVVGAGPVGLATAIELGTRGIDVVVLDEVADLPPGPRAQLVNMRTMEHFRRWGIAAELRAASLLPDGWPYEIVICTAPSGQLLARFPAFTTEAAGGTAFGTEAPQRIPQFQTQAVLRRRAAQLPNVRLELGVRVVDASERADGVHLMAEPTTGGARTERLEIDAGYVVGCDGGGSVVRRAMGVKYHGEGAISQQLGVFFECPGLVDRFTVGPALMYLVVNPRTVGLLGPVDGSRWWFQKSGYRPDDVLDQLDREDAVAIVRDAVGIPDLDVTVTGTQPWVMNQLVADCYGRGRLFVAGDAAHLSPPTGGHNMNTGIGDAVDIGWKLAAVLRGWGGPHLLDSYDAERRPVGDRNGAAARQNATHLAEAVLDAMASGLLGDGAPPSSDELSALGARMLATTRNEWVSVGVVFDHRYDVSPIVVADGTEAPPEAPDRYQPSARPGHRAPHVWLGPDESIHDRFGRGFTLVALPGSDPGPITASATARGVPLDVLEITDATVAGAYDHVGLTLVRPDQHVAWRGDAAPRDPERLWAHVLGFGPDGVGRPERPST